MEPKQEVNKSTIPTPSTKKWLMEGDDFYKTRKFKEALICYDKAVAEEPQNPLAWHNHAQALVMCLKYPESIVSCDKALEFNPQNAATWFLKSFAHGVTGEYEEALESCTKGLELDPGNHMVWCTRGQYLYALGRLEEALESISTGLKLSPNNEYFKEVNEKVKKWLQRDGQNPELVKKIMAFLQGGNQDALKAYDEALKVDPRSVVKAFNKDYALTHLENPEKMLKELEKARSIDRPQILFDLSQKEFEFGREAWVEVTLSNKGTSTARNLGFQFRSDVVLKQLEVTPAILQNLKAADKVTDLDKIPVLAPGNSVKKMVSLTPTKIGQIAIEAQVHYVDDWSETQNKTTIIWITVFKSSGKLPDIPGYKLIWRLSTGEAANVYVGQKMNESSRVVIKLMKFDPQQTSLITEFINDIKQCSKLVHPNIVRILNYGDNPAPWIAMEYLSQGPLSRRIGRTGIMESIQTGIKLADALSYAKNMRISHRNINPGNILFDEKDTPKLINWRVGNITQKLYKNNGTAENVTAYCSPEKMSNRFGNVDWLSDIYQLGAVLYEMLTGQKPFPGKGEDLMARIENEMPVRPGKLNLSINPDLDSLLLRCLAKNKNDRYQNPADLKSELERISHSYKE